MKRKRYTEEQINSILKEHEAGATAAASRAVTTVRLPAGGLTHSCDAAAQVAAR